MNINQNNMMRLKYKPPCTNYIDKPMGGIIVTPEYVYGSCSSNDPYNQPYDFICNSDGSNCRHLDSRISNIVYRDVNEFCCRSKRQDYLKPVYNLQNTNSCCDQKTLLNCANCLTSKGIVTTDDPNLNHYMNLQRCKNICQNY